jgi:diaminopimelate decarboxylase
VTHHFHYSGQNLRCESVDLAEVARLYGTPSYVYSAATMADNFTRLKGALGGLDAGICYAVKANSCLAVIRHLANLGASFEFASAGELRRVIAAGASPASSVFAGVGKTEEEIAFALESGILAFHVESEPELARISHVAGKLGRTAGIAFRINPDVDAGTHAKISTGRAENKFGIPFASAAAAYEAASKARHVELRGIQMHIGSQMTSAGPLVEAAGRLAPLVAKIRERFGISYFSIGGGIGIVYDEALASGQASWWEARPADRRPLTFESYGAALRPLLEPLGLRILVEPGRSLVGNAGVLLSRVEYVKRTHGRNFLVVDSAMNDLIRPALYEAHHEIAPLHRDTTRPALVADVVGPVCETADTFARDRRLQQVGEGEYLAFMSAGAYGRVMSSRYNSRAMPAEVLVHGSAFELVTPRETFEQMIAGERIPAFLRAGR